MTFFDILFRNLSDMQHFSQVFDVW